MSQKTWADRSPEERKQIERNRENASFKNPFSGKNKAQRNRLHGAFAAMKSTLNPTRL